MEPRIKLGVFRAHVTPGCVLTHRETISVTKSNWHKPLMNLQLFSIAQTHFWTLDLARPEDKKNGLRIVAILINILTPMSR